MKNITKALTLVLFAIGFASCGPKLEWHNELLEEETATYAVQAAYPKFEIEVLDKKIESTLRGYINQAASEAEEVKNESWFKPFEVAGTDTVAVTYDRYAAVNLQVYYFAGGAHGMTFNNTINYDAKEESFVSISQITNGKSADLINIIKQKLTEKLGKANFDDSQLMGVDSISNFMILDKGVLFLFDPSEVAAYVYGVNSVLVPYDEFDFNIEK